MGHFKTLAALVSPERYAKLVAAYGPRYIAVITAVFALFTMAAATVAATSAIEYRTIERLRAAGNTTEGQIVDLEIKSRRGRPAHQVWVTYQFADRDGQRHDATDYRQFRGPPGLAKAQPIDVLYDPAAPELSRLSVGLDGRLDDLKMVIVSCLFGVGLFGAFVGRYVQWRRRAHESPSTLASRPS